MIRLPVRRIAIPLRGVRQSLPRPPPRPSPRRKPGDTTATKTNNKSIPRRKPGGTTATKTNKKSIPRRKPDDTTATKTNDRLIPASKLDYYRYLMYSHRPLGNELEIRMLPDNLMQLDLGPGQITMPLLWLRDMCQCPKCVDPHSGQKNFSTVQLPDEPKVKTAVKLEDGSLRVVWENDGVFAGQDLHESIYPRKTLEEWGSERCWRTASKLPTQRKLWNKASYLSLLESGATKISYKDWTTDREAFHRAFAALSETGLIFLTDVPYGEQEVERIGNQIGMLQHTFYGTTWDVKSKPNAENVAYTSQFLGLHQDLMYHNPVPRLQLLHCLENSCEGGESLFSDGVHAALQLKDMYPEIFTVLTTNSLFFRYDKAPHHYERAHRPIQFDPDTGYVAGTHWAPPFQAPFPRIPGRKNLNNISLKYLKQAAGAFEKLLSSPSNMLEVKLNPGEAVIFDNWRVLHGRREFAAGGGGSRWLKGAYISPQVFSALDARRPQRECDPPVWPLPNADPFRLVLADMEKAQLKDLRKTGESDPVLSGASSSFAGVEAQIKIVHDLMEARQKSPKPRDRSRG